MLQEAIVLGQAKYLKELTKRADVSLYQIQEAQKVLDNKVKGLKLDRAILKGQK